MRKTSLFRLGAASFLALGLPPGSAAAQETERLTIERLYSLPHLIGTAPTGFAWNAQSDRVAFLWNDGGRNFRDVWTVDVDSRAPERWTRLPALVRDTPRPELEFDRELDAIEWSVRRESDRGVSAVVWHPDGERLVATFRGDLYEVSRDEATPIVSTPQAVTRARLSRDGATLAYIAGGDLWVRSGGLRGESTNVTALADEHRSVREYRLSPDGRMAAFIEADRSEVPLRAIPDYLTEEPELVRVPRPYPGDPSPKFRLGVVSVDGGATRWVDLDSGPMDPIFGLEWSEDSTRLVVDTSDLYVKDRRILVIDADSGRTRVLVREQNPLNVQALWQVAWAPDGNGIYFLSDRDDDTHVYYAALDAGTSEAKRITSGDWAVFSFAVFESEILFVANAGRPEERHVFRVGRGGGEPVRVSVRAGTHAPTFAPDGRFVADYFSSDAMPYELLLTEVSSEASAEDREQRITHSPTEEFSNYRWVEPEYITFQSHVDGVTLHGRLTVPPGLDRTKKHPAILGSVYSNTVRNQWGGRTAHPTWGLDQYLVQEGYILLNVNFRGSLGHGKSFRQGIRLDYGGIDVEDLESGVQYLESLGFVDMDRIGIWGSSYGGLLTCMSLFKKPGVYKAGVAGAPATNVWHALTGEMRVMMAPVDQPQEYAGASAFTFAPGLEDRLMIIHGMRDRIVLFQDSVSLVQRLVLLDKDVDFVVLPDSGHGWDNEELYQTRFAFRKLVQHFERHLGKGPTP